MTDKQLSTDLPKGLDHQVRNLGVVLHAICDLESNAAAIFSHATDTSNYFAAIEYQFTGEEMDAILEEVHRRG